MSPAEGVSSIHIGEKELRAVWLSLQFFNKHVQDALCLQLVTDNQVVRSVINYARRTSSGPFVGKIQDYCKCNNLTILARCTPSSGGCLWQISSRASSTTVTGVSDFFRKIERPWFRRPVDHFAMSSNAMCQ
eukprot:m.175382 g.175382  ORF g.175382 m.175382 type:complete len:132 (-) comp53316_c0_seq27:463-858(-)